MIATPPQPGVECLPPTAAATPSRPRVRVGFVMHSMQVAGAEVLVAHLIRRLADQIDSTVICLDRLGAIGHQLRDEGIRVVSLGRRPGLDWRLPRRLAEVARTEQIDLLHAHQYTPFFYAALARLCGARRCRLILTEHGRHFPDVVGAKRRWLNRLLLRRLAHAANACCQFSALAVEQNDGFGRGRVDVIRNGIDVARYEPLAASRDAIRAELGLQPDCLYVVAVARFHPIKDHATLLRAFSQVAPRLPQCRLLLVGDGELRADMEQMAADAGLGQRVEFWGVRRDVDRILAAADLFVLPSLCEAASLTLLEAMAAGCPVVVTDVGGNPEIVAPGREGLLIPRGDAPALAEAILALLADAPRRRAMGAAGRRRVREQYDLRDTVEAYRTLYLRLARG